MRKEMGLWVGAGCIGLAVLLALVLGGYRASDPSIIHCANHPLVVKHFFGSFGALGAGLLLYLFGWGAWLLCALCVGFGAVLLAEYTKSDRYDWTMPVWRPVGLWLCGIGVLALVSLGGPILYAHVAPGGACGFALVTLMLQFVGRTCAVIVGATAAFCGAVLAFGLSPWSVAVRGAPWLIFGAGRLMFIPFRLVHGWYVRGRRPIVYSSLSWLVRETVDPDCSLEQYQKVFSDPAFNAIRSNGVSSNGVRSDHVRSGASFATESGQVAPGQAEPDRARQVCMPATQSDVALDALDRGERYLMPSLELLASAGDWRMGERHNQDQQLVQYQDRAHVVEEKLRTFGIDGHVVSVVVGPVVVVYEFLPAIYVKVSRILAFEDDLALALQAHSLRIIAPVPGKSVVRFEVSKDASEREIVRFGTMLELIAQSKKARETCAMARLPLALGRGVLGDPIVVDLASMPHLLIAGATGSGKSVVTHSCIATLLWNKTPDELGLIIIDPKQLECAVYQSLPHMLFAPVTQTVDALRALGWVIGFMENRYQEMAAAGVRTFEEFVAAVEQPVQRLVIIIDELADLMLTAGKEFEFMLVRIAQMGRAAGIHLTIATQRPSVDVVTGLIKANFPARLALRVASKIDSRIIIDMYGAHTLLGRGDMLVVTGTGDCVRVHGAFITQTEIEAIVMHHAKQRSVAHHSFDEFGSVADMPMSGESGAEDPALYSHVKQYVLGREEVSISQLQRQFRIGFNRSARLIEQLERDGVIARAQGSKPRRVMR